MASTIMKYKKNKEPYESLYKLNIGRSLDEYEAEDAMTAILAEKDTEKRISLMTMLLNGIMIKGPTVNEVKGLLNASLALDNILCKQKLKIDLPENEMLIGVAASGKKGFKTINITTTACFVAAACGAYIAKASSHSTSSKTGSSDFLEIVGINPNIPIDKKIEVLRKNRISFFSIEDTTPNFAKVYGGIFYAPHAMSFALAGLSFPIEIDALAYGISHPNVKLSIEIYKSYGFNNALVYSSTEDGVHYLDELIPSGYVNIVGMKDGKIGRQISAPIRESIEFESSSSLMSLSEKENKLENVQESLKTLAGKGSSDQIDAICLNAAIIMLLSRKSESLEDGYFQAKQKIKDGSAFKLLLDVVEQYGGNPDNIKKMLI